MLLQQNKSHLFEVAFRHTSLGILPMPAKHRDSLFNDSFPGLEHFGTSHKKIFHGLLYCKETRVSQRFYGISIEIWFTHVLMTQSPLLHASRSNLFMHTFHAHDFSCTRLFMHTNLHVTKSSCTPIFMYANLHAYKSSRKQIFLHTNLPAHKSFRTQIFMHN